MALIGFGLPFPEGFHGLPAFAGTGFVSSFSVGMLPLRATPKARFGLKLNRKQNQHKTETEEMVQMEMQEDLSCLVGAASRVEGCAWSLSFFVVLMAAAGRRLPV